MVLMSTGVEARESREEGGFFMEIVELLFGRRSSDEVSSSLD
jgi:hypothetical protein